jgi:hypothetical protein
MQEMKLEFVVANRIVCVCATGLAPKCHFFPGLPSESLEIPKVGNPMTLKAHKFLCTPMIEMRSKTKLRTFQRIGMSHATYMQGNQGDS